LATTYRIDKARRIVFAKASGRVTDDEAFAEQRRLEADPDFEPDMGQLFDGREVSEFRVTSPGIRRLARRSPFGRGSRRALVAARDDTYGMARMYEMLRLGQGDEVTVVRSLSEALAWLGLAEEPE